MVSGRPAGIERDIARDHWCGVICAGGAMILRPLKLRQAGTVKLEKPVCLS
jgi:hypothetical protein